MRNSSSNFSVIWPESSMRLLVFSLPSVQLYLHRKDIKHDWVSSDTIIQTPEKAIHLKVWLICELLCWSFFPIGGEAVSGVLPVGTCRHSVSINQHEALMDLPGNLRSRSHVISCTSYGSHSHLLKGGERTRLRYKVQTHPVIYIYILKKY